MSSRTLQLLALAASAVIATGVVLLLGNTPEPKPQDPAPTKQERTVSDNNQARAATGTFVPTAKKTKMAKAEPNRKLELPDGTLVDALNGAVDAPPMKDYWGPFKWSPIVGVERSSAGLDWYKHADGSYSTTQMVMRTDLGRMAAMTRVAHPGPAPAKTAPQQPR